jgi:hypothetical protein
MLAEIELWPQVEEVVRREKCRKCKVEVSAPLHMALCDGANEKQPMAGRRSRSGRAVVSGLETSAACQAPASAQPHSAARRHTSPAFTTRRSRKNTPAGWTRCCFFTSVLLCLLVDLLFPFPFCTNYSDPGFKDKSIQYAIPLYHAWYTLMHYAVAS